MTSNGYVEISLFRVVIVSSDGYSIGTDFYVSTRHSFLTPTLHSTDIIISLVAIDRKLFYSQSDTTSYNISTVVFELMTISLY